MHSMPTVFVFMDAAAAAAAATSSSSWTLWHALVRGTLTAWNVDSSAAGSNFFYDSTCSLCQSAAGEDAAAAAAEMLLIVYGPSSQEQFLDRLWLGQLSTALRLQPHLDALVTIFSAYRFPILFLTC